jgi:hypothetical protein
MSQDFKTAVRIVWLAVTLITAVAALAPFVLSEAIIAGISPVCESKRRYGTECWMCGTTTAFIAISQGDWSAAVRSNRTAVPLFTLFLLNATVAAVYVARRAR